MLIRKKVLETFFLSVGKYPIFQTPFLWSYLPSDIKLQINYVYLLSLALSETILLDMGPVQIVDSHCNSFAHNCMVHSLQIMQIYWTSLEKDKLRQLKNVIPHMVIPNSKSSSCLVFQKGHGQTGKAQPTAIKMK